MSTQHATDLIISGGGVPGLALACLLAPLGLRVAVIDPAPFTGLSAAKPDSRTAALMQGSIAIIRATGAWEACVPFGAELRTLRIVDENAPRRKKIQADFNAPEIDLPAFAVNMPNGILRAALCDVAAADKNIILLPGRRLRDYTAAHNVTATLDDGTVLTAPLIVGTDGRHSRVREIAGIAARTHDFKQAAITCLLRHSRAHEFISTEFHRLGGPFTLVPLPGKQSSLVWVEDTATAEKLMRLPRAAFVQTLQDRTNGILGTVTMDGTPTCWPLTGLRVARLSAPRMILAAEAAHVLTPLGAQGLNLSLRDIATLAELIADAARLGVDIGGASVREAYERRRATDVDGHIIGTTGLSHMVATTHPALHGLRRAGLRLVHGIAPLRTLAMQKGLAPQDHQSRLLQGKPL